MQRMKHSNRNLSMYHTRSADVSSIRHSTTNISHSCDRDMGVVVMYRNTESQTETLFASFIHTGPWDTLLY